MDEEKDVQRRKKEAAGWAKQLARERLAAKQAAGQTEQPLEETKTQSKDDLALAKKKAAEAAKAKAAELRKQKEGAAGDKAGKTEDGLALAKKKAAEEAKAAALEKRKAPQAEGGNKETSEEDIALAKKKAAAAAKAKAAALAKKKAAAAGEGVEDDIAKQKALAAAKAKAAAAAKAKALAKQQAGGTAGESEGDLAKEKAKAAAAAKAKAAALAKAKSAGNPREEAEKEDAPSPNQPLLDKYVRMIRERLGGDVLEEAYINRLAKDVPTLVVKKDAYYKVAEFLKYNEQLRFDYLSELHGTDFQTHMEVYVHLYSYQNRQPVALKVKIDRDKPEIASLVPLWQGANWPECEAYDLLGIRFQGHPNLIRIFLGENWVGHPLRKDYEPYDVEV
ncbi:NADH-quinone oxidoreductase subunit C [Parageobacillus thermoglucosidasius]|uniref:NADH-quinone oxidoreductase subunit C n=1 Tax=Parageobacillus thermoglucosidasius TaxID=1426 RepID=UPI0001D1846E|nr:NADH-quinone oxidoreductase subunit C [Parageobacillus thermoglucosidasius]KYD11924.1 NADH-ubiquinone oxidoreductase chain C [Anoxybacillus flavithermus]REK57109.1 MAG: NADH-quinone oxidoreductase subunit C [Geobacillus sp.]AEH49611.1 NADH dehydrogenase (ubiquinone) 30 kDa subunit [Parageobacillus thermoglucosidasius C56-YS93]EID42672.1 respiratory-chain NADH dehydrogenase, 30 Kd subunit [Parageobacillus thermoglucosidasius TNO-09.020]OAO88042.1 NADH-ubiquinone oxidoreductase chain C [Parag